MTHDRDELRLDLACTGCSWIEECDGALIEYHLRRAGRLKREPHPGQDLLRELVVGVASRLTCPQCGQTGIAVRPSPAPATDWPEAARCQRCGGAIDPERLEIFPGATTCVQCQRRDDGGQIADEPQYCPRCGTAMVVKQSSAGITRYALVCPACRGRSR